MNRRIIVNADDFGLSPAVNRAVARAHRQGVLTSASLLVSAPGTADAVATARELPELGLGIHLALTELAPLTPAPRLAPGGRFPASHALVHARLLAGRVPPAELRDELAAQLDAALATGLRFDHVDGHGHIHILPPVLRELVPLSRARGIQAMRLPREPTWAPARSLAERLKALLLRHWSRRAAGLARPDGCLGLAASGALTAEHLLAIAARLPAGVWEIACHPADGPTYRGYDGPGELAALLDPRVREALGERCTFAAVQGSGR